MRDPRQILVISSQAQQCKPVVLALDQPGWKVRVAFTLEDARKTLMENEIPVACCSTELLDGNFRDVLELVRSRRLATRVLVMAGSHDASRYMEAMELGAFDFLPTGVNEREVQRIVGNAMHARQALGGALAAGA